MKNHRFIIIPILLVTVVAISLVMLLPRIPSDSHNEPTSPQIQGGEIKGEGSPTDIFRIEIWDVDEYNSFVRTSEEVTDNFIVWDMVKLFGAFRSFKVRADTTSFRYNYMYNLENGEIITLKINSKGLYRRDTPISSTDLGSTMIKLTASKEGKFANGGLTYYYGSGNLAGIEWTIGNNTFYLDDFTAEYPYWTAYGNLPEDHIISKLLSVDPEVQLAALNELKAAIENN